MKTETNPRGEWVQRAVNLLRDFQSKLGHYDTNNDVASECDLVIAGLSEPAPPPSNGCDGVVTIPAEFAQLGTFYDVATTDELLRQMEDHIEKLQDAARRNVKPWEDTFPPTLLPRYLRENGLPPQSAPTTVIVHTASAAPESVAIDEAMVERVARALYVRDYPQSAPVWDAGNVAQRIRDGYAGQARAALEAAGLAGGQDAIREALEAVKVRLHFNGMPQEPMFNFGTDDAPRWRPDWRHEIALIEHALHGAPLTPRPESMRRDQIPPAHPESAARLFTNAASATERLWDGVPPGTAEKLHEYLDAKPENAARQEAVAIKGVHLRRDTSGKCVVRLGIDGQWVEVIRDFGDVIDHYVATNGSAEYVKDTAATPHPSPAQSEGACDCMRGVLTIIEQAEDKARRNSRNREWAEWMRHQYEGEVRAYGYAARLIRNAIAASTSGEGHE